MEQLKKSRGRKLYGAVAVFLAVNLAAVIIIGVREAAVINNRMQQRAEDTAAQFESVMENYRHSFRLFVEMMLNEIKSSPDPDSIWDFLKGIDSTMLEIEGDTFDGLYMYYQGRYLYSWDTPYSQYEETGYVATERPWYKDAAAGAGEIVFTPPYMSYANHYILTTLSQLQPDGETVFAYDIKMGDIQRLVSSMEEYKKEEILIYDKNGTVIGSTKEDYLGGSLLASMDAVSGAVEAPGRSLRQRIRPMGNSIPKRRSSSGRRKSSAASARAFSLNSTGWPGRNRRRSAFHSTEAGITDCCWRRGITISWCWFRCCPC